MIEKIRQLEVVYYQLDSNGVDDLEVLQERYAFLDPNPHKVYNLTV